jgi:hypothetical protein
MIHESRKARRRRRTLAQGFEALLDDAHGRGLWYSARVPVERDQVLDAEREIERLIGRLRGARAVRADALRLAHDLLCDRHSPLFEPTAPGSLRRRVRVVCDAVE